MRRGGGVQERVWRAKLNNEFPELAEIRQKALSDESIFPVPLLTKPATTSTSKRVLRRVRRRTELWRDASEMIEALNECYGSPLQRPTSKPRTVEKDVEMAWQRVHASALMKAKGLRTGRREFPTGAAAINELVKQEPAGVYSWKPQAHSQVNLQADAVDEPSHHDVVPMLAAMADEEAFFYTDEAHVVDPVGKSEVLFKEIEQHYGFVGGSEGEYEKYFQRDNLPNQMWTFARESEVKAVAGFAVVPKKDPEKQRKLLMTCATNYWWNDATKRADFGLHGGGALGRVLVEGGDLVKASFDLSNAFTSILTPSWMWSWMAVPPVRAGAVWSKLGDELRKELQPHSWVYPLYMRLPMGCSHSVHILMHIVFERVGATFRAQARLRPAVGSGPPVLPQWVADASCEAEAFSDDAFWKEKMKTLKESGGGCAGSGYTVKGWIEAVRASKTSGSRVFVGMHLFGGERRRDDIQERMEERAKEEDLKLLFLTADLAVDINWDLASPETFAALLDLCEGGLVDCLVGGPPCATWSVARFRVIEGERGPRPLRDRYDYAWGLPNLKPYEQERVREANVLMLNLLCLCEAVAKRGGAYVLEHPDDPGHPYPSIWAIPTMQAMEKRVGAVRARIHQCAFGGPTLKPTCLSGTALGLLAGVRCCPGLGPNHRHETSVGRTAAGVFQTRRLQTYPPDLCKYIADCLFNSLADMRAKSGGPGGADLGGTMRRVSCWTERVSLSGRPAITVLNEAAVKGERVMMDSKRMCFYLHVDDGVFMASSGSEHASRRDAEAAMHRSAAALEKMGFRVTTQASGSEEKVVGYTFSSYPAKISPPRGRVCMLREALLTLAGRSRVDTGVLRSLLGLWLWMALLRRELLAVPCKIFQFVRVHEAVVTRWWESVRKEVIIMAHLLPYAFHSAGRPLPKYVFATDAEGSNSHDRGGYGIVGTKVCYEDALRIYESGTVPKKTVTRLDGAIDNLKDPERELNARIPFSSVPQDLLMPGALEWEPLCWGRWRWEDAICLGEGRATIKLLDSVACLPHAHGHWVQSLMDNSVWAGAAAKGRSTAPSVNYLLRRRSAICLAADLGLSLPWTDTSRMPADGLSRIKGARAQKARRRPTAEDISYITSTISCCDPAFHHLGHRTGLRHPLGRGAGRPFG